jgi:hypothetical protein
MKTIQITQHELQQATRPSVHRNKKKYTRKIKAGLKLAIKEVDIENKDNLKH